MKSRILLLFAAFLLLWLVMLARGAFLQILPNSRLAGLQKRQFETRVEVNGRRGIIVDRNGRELAASVPSHSLYVDPQILDQPVATARQVAKILRTSSKRIYAKFKNRGRRFVWIKRHLTEAEYEKLKKLDIRGLGTIEEPKRIYPNQDLLAQTLGRVGVDGQGLEGIELQYDEVLRGERRGVVLPRDARGRPLLREGGIITNVSDGETIELTIDSELQFIVERELRSTVREHEADSAVGVVLDPNSGEILAMASADTKGVIGRNRVVTDVFEPGSTMKTFVVAAALREGIAKPSTKFYCEKGRFKIGGRWIKEADRDHHYEWLTVSEILAYSSNIGTAKLAMALGAERLRQALVDFGFGQRLGIDFPGEAKGVLQGLPWRDHLLGNISFGHGISVTPLQMAAAYAAIANGGQFRQPYIVRKTLPQKPRSVLSRDQAATLRLLLRAATMEHATGEKARIPGFPVAGKTGTAQKVDLIKGGYLQGSYISSFAGFVPAHDPRFVIYIAVDNPKREYYASQVAAPVFARVAQFAVRQAGLTPILLSENNLISQQASPIDVKRTLAALAAQEAGMTPNLKGLTAREVLHRVRGSQLSVEFLGKGVVASTHPAAGESIPNDKKLRVFLEPIR